MSPSSLSVNSTEKCLRIDDVPYPLATPRSWFLPVCSIALGAMDPVDADGPAAAILREFAEGSQSSSEYLLIVLSPARSDELPEKILEGYTVFLIGGMLRKLQRVAFIPSMRTKLLRVESPVPADFALIPIKAVAPWDGKYRDEEESGPIEARAALNPTVIAMPAVREAKVPRPAERPLRRA